jgi:hypothetical protein
MNDAMSLRPFPKANGILRPIVGSVSLACAGVAFAMQSGTPLATDNKAYKELRKKLGIQRAVAPDALDMFVGKRTLELKGWVKGTFEVDGKRSILLETEDKESEVFEASEIPAWMSGQDIPVRVIIEAKRASEFDSLVVKLLGAAPESFARQLDPKPVVVKPKTTKTTTSNNSTATTSRGGSANRKVVPVHQLVPVYADFVRRQNPRLTPEKATEIANGVIGFSLRYGVDARLIMAIVYCESTFNPNDTSHTGAMGLGQLMPETARELGVSNAYDTTQNLYGTVKLIRSHLDKYGKSHDDFQALVLSLAAYNAGPGAVKRHGGVPPYRETQRYVQKVIAVYKQLCGQ